MDGMLSKGNVNPMKNEIKPGIRRYLSKIGRKGGKSRSAKKRMASRRNGKLGGRPK